MKTRARTTDTPTITRRTLLTGLAASASLAVLTACGGHGRVAQVVAPPSVVPAPGPHPTATPLPTAPPRATATPGPLNDTVAVWTDPRGLIRVSYPATWRTGMVPAERGRVGNILELTVPYEGNPTGWPALWLDLVEPQPDTLDGAVQRARDTWVGASYTLSEQVVEDITIDGEPAKQFRFVYTPTFNPTLHSIGRDVFVNHGGRGFVIETNGNTGEQDPTIRQRQIDVLLASIRFLT